MRRREVALLAAGAIAAFAAVDWLGDRTQTRPDPIPPGSSTEVVFEVSTRDPRFDRRQAAQGLWGACQHTAHRVAHAGDVAVDGTQARVVMTPGIGKHAKQRLRGCLEDLTVDRTRARVVRMTDRGPPAPPER